MEITVRIEENEFEKLIKYFAYRYIINFEKISFEYDVRLKVKPFLQLIEHHSKTIRQLAFKVLGKAKYKDATDHLIKALNNRSGSVRGAAAWCLGEIQDRKAIKPLLLALSDHKSGYHAMMALRNLLGSDDLEYEMVKNLGDSDSRICVGAATVLLNATRPADTTRALIKVLLKNNRKCRHIAATVLGQGDSIKACKAIIESFKIPESNLAVIDAKCQALKSLRTRMQESIRVIDKYFAGKNFCGRNYRM